MNITTRIGAKIMVTEASARNGYAHDTEEVLKHLKLNTPYTVKWLDVGNWHTDVYIEEVPDIPFNSVNFVNIDKNFVKDEDLLIDEINEELGLNYIPPHNSGG